MKSTKKFKQWQKNLFLTGIYAAIALLISVSVLFYLDNFYFNDNINAINPQNNTTDLLKVHPYMISDIPKEATNISFSHDNLYCMYLNNGIIYVKNIQTNKINSKITESSKINAAVLLDDRNMIIYFTISRRPKKSTDILNVNTYNIDNSQKNLQQTFNISSGFNVKKVDYSNLTNLILINTGKNSNGNIEDKVYCINIMKQVRKFVTDKTVDNMVLLNKSLSLYYQNSKGLLFCNSNKVKSLENQRINLLGRDSNDNIYVQSYKNKEIIYVVNNKEIIKTLSLKDLNYKEIVSNRSDIYAVYNDHVIDLAGDLSKTFSYDKNSSFINIVNNVIYLKKDNIIKTEKLFNN
jgi:hypothetical protein